MSSKWHLLFVKISLTKAKSHTSFVKCHLRSKKQSRFSSSGTCKAIKSHIFHKIRIILHTDKITKEAPIIPTSATTERAALEPHPPQPFFVGASVSLSDLISSKAISQRFHRVQHDFILPHSCSYPIQSIV